MTIKIKRSINPQSVIEGAGVKLLRSIAPSRKNEFDPFLLFDHFGFNDPAEGENPGFPTHPHRGIETVTYLLEGAVRHRDSIGNVGLIKPGEVQWMSAGRGILHEEMPRANEFGKIVGFQLWVNLPASEKMSPPRYQEISAAELPVYVRDGFKVKVLAGNFEGLIGPVKDISIEPNYFHFQLEEGKNINFETKENQTSLIYLIDGSIQIQSDLFNAPEMLVFDEAQTISIIASKKANFLFISGKKIGEEVVPYGPFVMNTENEIRQTIADLRNGTFGK